MNRSEAYKWLKQGKRRQEAIVLLKQPMTVKQLSKAASLTLDCTSFVLAELENKGFIVCLNPDSRRSRLFWLTDLGKDCRKRLRKERQLSAEEPSLPDIDWKIYGWVCFNHRAAVLKALREPLQPASIKRMAYQNDPTLRMSSNNVRDVIRLFVGKGIVEPVKVRKKAYPKYALTELGTTLRQLLLGAENRHPS